MNDLQKIIEAFDLYLKTKNQTDPTPYEPELEPPEPEPMTINDVLNIKELRDAINIERAKHGKVKFV